jgi:hypothetical protein
MTEDITKLIFGESIPLTPTEYKAMEYVGPLAAAVGWTATQTLEAIRLHMPEDGAKAGTSLRLIIMTLCNNNRSLREVLIKYDISYWDVDPRYNYFDTILKTFAEKDISHFDIDSAFGRVANDFRELISDYRKGEIKNDTT